MAVGPPLDRFPADERNLEMEHELQEQVNELQRKLDRIIGTISAHDSFRGIIDYNNVFPYQVETLDKCIAKVWDIANE